MAARKTSALIILDGWGYRKDGDSNAIAAANTPVWGQLWASAPHTQHSASGEGVGLPDGQPHTAHTCDVVPLVYVDARAISSDAGSNGLWCAVAPTLLRPMQLEQPSEKTGTPLLTVN